MRPFPLSRSSRLALRTGAGLCVLALLTGAGAVSCAGDTPDDGVDRDLRPASGSLGRWTPATDNKRFPGECTQAVHDSYYVIGPDGRKYPTWHGPMHVDADGRVCYFGHEHGDNPRNSALYDLLRQHFAWDADGNGAIGESEWNNDTTGIPFGYAAEYGGDPAAIRHDSYKIALVNGAARQRVVNGVAQDFGLVCDQLLAYAQDTETSAAFFQYQHPLTYAIDCNASGDAAGLPTRLILSVMADYGSAQAPAATSDEAAAALRIPDAATQVWPQALVAAGRSSDLAAALEERWDTLVSIQTAAGTELARVNPGLVSRDPSRYAYDGAAAASIALCYAGIDANGVFTADPAAAAGLTRIVRGSTDCSRLAATGPATPLARRVEFDARDAQFKGCSRQAIWRRQTIRNGNGPNLWYTTPAGGDARSTRFAGSLRQYIAIGVSSSAVVLAPFTDDAGTDCAASTGIHVRAEQDG